MKKIIIISILLFSLTSCFKNEEVKEVIVEENSTIWEELTIELGWVSSWSWETTISNTWVSPLDFKN